MFNTLWSAQYNSDIIYCRYNGTDERYEFYINQYMVRVLEGTMGTFKFECDPYKLVVTSKLKISYDLTVDGKAIPMNKIKKRDLQNLLSSKNIYNVVNPTKEDREQAKFKWNDLVLPLMLMLLAIGIQYFTYDKSWVFKIIPGIPCLMAGAKLYGIVIKHARFLEPLRKLAPGIFVLVFVVVEYVSSVLYG